MTIKKNLVSASKYNIKCPYAMIPTRIVVHNTGNDAPAANEVKYMASNNNQVSFHYAVDDHEVIQGIPENRNTWNAGDGNGKGNHEGIAIEICYSKSGGPRFEQAENNAAEFIATILKARNWSINRVTKHQDYNGKYCPHRTLDLGWDRFLKMIQANMAPLTLDTKSKTLKPGELYTVLARTFTQPKVTVTGADIIAVQAPRSDAKNRGYLIDVRGKKAGFSHITVSDGTTSCQCNFNVKE